MKDSSKEIDNKNNDINKNFEKIKLNYNLSIEKVSIIIQLQILWQQFLQKRQQFFNRFPLVWYSIKRILFGLLTLLLAICVIFVLLRLITHDSHYISDIDLTKAGIIPGTEEYKNLLTERMKMFGVHGPIINQLGTYLKNITPFIKKTIIIGTFYDSSKNKLIIDSFTTWFYLGIVFSSSVAQPGEYISSLFAQAIPYSFSFGSVAVVITFLIGIPLGIITAKNKEKHLDRFITSSNAALITIPPVILVSALYLLSLSVFGGRGIYSNDNLSTMIWPILAISLMLLPTVILNTRRYMIDEMTAEYTKFALSKGMTNNYVFYIHIFRNAGIRIIRLIPVMLVGALFGSSIFVENAWLIPGMSRFIVSGVKAKDSFVVMGYIILAATTGIITSLISDIITAILDPRIKLAKS